MSSPAPREGSPQPTAAAREDPSDHPTAWMHTVLQHAQDILTAVGPDGRILYDSPSVERILGYSQGELVGRNAFELIHPDDLAAAFEVLLHTAAHPGAGSSLVYRFRHRDGGWKLLESVGVATADPAGVTVVVNSRELCDRSHAADPIHRTRAEMNPSLRGASPPREEVQIEMLERLAHAAELRDDETGRHTRRVAELAGRLAETLGRPPEEVENARRAAALHDLGKIGVPDRILRKRGALTAHEMRVMRTHTVLGARILAGSRSELVRTAEQIALHHHERWDGAGYPHGLSGEEIPLTARIVAVVDCFDALTHDRPYRAARPRREVVRHISSARGAHFDPTVADAFLGLVSDGKEGGPKPPDVAVGSAENMQ